MALMDKIKEVANQGLDIAKDLGEKGLDKAKDLRDITSSKAKIMMAENKIKDVYTEIGKLVVEAGGLIPEEGIQEQLNKIAELNEDIKNAEAAIQAAKDEKSE